jgi:hypothetical protein
MLRYPALTSSGLAADPALSGLNQPTQAGRSDSGTPSSSEMTVTASGWANCESSSTVPLATNPSMSSPVIRRTAGRKRSMRRGVKDLPTSRRRRV